MHADRAPLHRRTGAPASRRRSTRPGSTPSRWRTATVSADRASTTATARTPTLEWIDAAAEVMRRARLTTLLSPGSAPSRTWRGARRSACTSVRIATHCTEADISAQHIAWAREHGMDVSGFLMMQPHARARTARRAGHAHGVVRCHCVYVTDSGGPPDRAETSPQRVGAYRDVLDPRTEIGIHAHENLSLSVANSVTAVEHGAVRVDASLAGQGAGAGNCPAGGLRRGGRPAGLGARLRPLRPAGRGR